MSAVIIREIKSGVEVERLDTTGKSERQIEKLIDGLSINFNFEKYWIDTEEES